MKVRIRGIDSIYGYPAVLCVGPPLYHEAPPDYFASVAEQPPPTSYPPPNMSHMASVSGQPFFSAPQPSQQFIPTPGMAPPFLPPPMLQVHQLQCTHFQC